MKKLYIVLALLVVTSIGLGLYLSSTSSNHKNLKSSYMPPDTIEYFSPRFYVGYNFNYYDEMINWMNNINPDKVSFKERGNEEAKVLDYYEKSFKDVLKTIKTDNNILLPFYENKEIPLTAYDIEGLYNIYFSSNFLYDLPATYYHTEISGIDLITVITLDKNIVAKAGEKAGDYQYYIEKSKNDFKKDFPDVNVLQPPTLDTWQEENYGLAGLYYKTLIIDNEPRECEIKELKVDLPKVHVSFVYENLLVTVVGELKLLEKALLDLSFRPVSLTNYTYPESEKQMGTEAQTTWYDGYNPENEVFTTTAPY